MCDELLELLVKSLGGNKEEKGVQRSYSYTLIAMFEGYYLCVELL